MILDVQSQMIGMRAKLSDSASSLRLELPWAKVSGVQVVSHSSLSNKSVQPILCRFRHNILRLKWNSPVPAGTELVLKGSVEFRGSSSSSSTRLLLHEICALSQDILADLFVLQCPPLAAVELSSGVRIDASSNGIHRFHFASIYSWILLSSQPLVPAEGQNSIFCPAQASDHSWHGDRISYPHHLIIHDPDRVFDLPCEFCVSPSARLIVISPFACDADSPHNRDACVFSFPDRVHKGLVTPFLMQSAMHASTLHLGPGNTLTLRDPMRTLMLLAYGHARALSSYPHAAVIRMLWLAVCAETNYRNPDLFEKKKLLEFHEKASDMQWCGRSDLIMNVAFAMHALGTQSLDFFAKECTEYHAPPTEIAFATVGRISGHAVQYMQPAIPLPQGYLVSSKCIGTNTKTRTMQVNVQGKISHRSFQIHSVDIFRGAQISTVSATSPDQTYFIPLQTGQVAKKCGRPPKTRSIITDAWAASNFDFVHAIKVASDESKRKFWVVLPPLAVRSLLVDPLHASLLVPIEFDLALPVMLETLDLWRFSRENQDAITLHVLACVRSLCLIRNRKTEFGKQGLKLSYVAGTLCAVLVSPPLAQNPVYTTLIRLEVVRGLSPPHMLHALQYWANERFEAMCQDPNRFVIFRAIIARLGSEKDSPQVRALFEFCLRLLQTAPFTSDLRLLHRISCLICSEYAFNHATLSDPVHLKMAAADAKATCEQYGAFD